MKTVIYANIKSTIVSEIDTAIMLEDYPVEIKTAKSFNTLYRLLESDDSSAIILGPDMVDDDGFNPARLQGHAVYSYIRKESDAAALKRHKIPCVGMLKSTEQVLKVLVQGKFTELDLSAFGKEDSPVQPQIVTPVKKPEPVLEEQPQEKAEAAPKAPVQAPLPEKEVPAANPAPAIPGMTQEQMMAMMQFMQQFQMSQQAAAAPAPTSVQEPEKKGKSLKRGQDRITTELEKDGIFLNRKQKKEKATVVTVYAAKGGVGKTTIATELAAYLSLTTDHNEKISVCVIDYNIDFGDVCSHLGLSPKGNNMVVWASEIDAMIKDGQSPDSITFTTANIRKEYLQRMQKTGLYALVAPIAHEDSMDISDEALRVMLRNIVENGNFDFVVVDTGNNTRDAAIIALEAAEHILLVATQDLTTANCNSAVLDVMKKMQTQRPGLNPSKVNLVINNIIPASNAGVSPRDVEEAFPFPCIARIKHTTDIVKANNFSKPLIYNPKHAFTLQIGRIVEFITTGEVAEEEPEKKPGLFARLFKR